MINSIDVNLSNLDKLDKFLKQNPIGTNSFRYYNKRNYDVISNHLKTKLYFIDTKCIGYGHIDFENKLWLGIIVSDTEHGKKYGDFIMDDLLADIKEDVYLTVDKNNIKAFELYKKKNFKIIEEKYNHYLMIKKNN